MSVQSFGPGLDGSVYSVGIPTAEQGSPGILNGFVLSLGTPTAVQEGPNVQNGLAVSVATPFALFGDDFGHTHSVAFVFGFEDSFEGNAYSIGIPTAVFSLG